jgi:Protein phosphatase 2C
MIFADSYFTIGKQHANEGKPCQDYAVTQVSEDGAIAVVSDGCSTGGKTDFGARIVAHAMLRSSLTRVEEQETLMEWILQQGAAAAPQIKLNDLFATAFLIKHYDRKIFFRGLGDGVVAVKLEDGTIKAVKFEWDKGIPFYPVYRQYQFIEQVGDGDKYAIGATSETCLYSPETKTWEIEEKDNLTISYGMQGFLECWESDCKAPEQNSSIFAAVFSDGITQIKDVDWKDAVFEFMNYKSTSGEFVKRRMMKALKTMTPMDDISCAALRITPDADNEADTANA